MEQNSELKTTHDANQVWSGETISKPNNMPLLFYFMGPGFIGHSSKMSLLSQDSSAYYLFSNSRLLYELTETNLWTLWLLHTIWDHSLLFSASVKKEKKETWKLEAYFSVLLLPWQLLGSSLMSCCCHSKKKKSCLFIFCHWLFSVF